jgi:hypothetical protein
MPKQAKYKRLSKIIFNCADHLPEKDSLCLVRDVLRLYPKIENTRAFQKYMTDHVDLIASSEIEGILKAGV